jgi:hypothetical protein
MSFSGDMGTDDGDNLTVGQRDKMKESLMSTDLDNLCVLKGNRNLMCKHYHHPCSQEYTICISRNCSCPKGNGSQIIKLHQTHTELSTRVPGGNGKIQEMCTYLI